jgi:hypothetical protein
MLIVEFVGGELIVGDVQAFGNAAVNGSIEGIKDAADILARDVTAHTPKKTGKARESIITKVTQGGRLATVKYDYRKSQAFYMRFIILGAKPHTITPKMRTDRGRRTARARKLKALLKSGMQYGPAYAAAASYAAGLTRKRAMAFEQNGESVFTRAVRHPGIRPTKIISDRVKASQGPMVTALQEAVRRNIERAHAQRSSYRGGRIG